MREAGWLLEWYDTAKRDLPWRRTDDAYLVWVSEVMLQQTRVETVLPYFGRFKRRFPDVACLAAAELDEVLALWSGLGYYRRARQLHAAARQIVASGGKLPRTVAELRELPGVGPYTAAAIASIAFGVVTPVLDGNVERVLSRWLALSTDPRRGPGRAALLELAAKLLDAARPGDSNQALMELGATYCSPKSPDCDACPLAVSCRARMAGSQESYPRLPARKKPQNQKHLAAVAVRESRVLLFRRPDDSSLLAGIWEIPWVPEVEPLGGPTRPVEERLSASYGGRWTLGESHGRVRHAITHRALDVEVVSARHEGNSGLAEGREGGWWLPRELEGLALSSLAVKILSRAGLVS